MIDIGTKVWINGSSKNKHYEVLGVTESGFYILDAIMYGSQDPTYVRRHGSPFVHFSVEEVMVVDNV
jgi:hypothetical protein